MEPGLLQPGNGAGHTIRRVEDHRHSLEVAAACDLGKLLLEVDHLAESQEIRLERQARRSQQQ